MAEYRNSILTIDEYPNWKERVLRFVAWLLGEGRNQHIAFIRWEDECSTCHGVGTLMTVDTYENIDCPDCDGRG